MSDVLKKNAFNLYGIDLEALRAEALKLLTEPDHMPSLVRFDDLISILDRIKTPDGAPAWPTGKREPHNLWDVFCFFGLLHIGHTLDNLIALLEHPLIQKAALIEPKIFLEQAFFSFRHLNETLQKHFLLRGLVENPLKYLMQLVNIPHMKEAAQACAPVFIKGVFENLRACKSRNEKGIEIEIGKIFENLLQIVEAPAVHAAAQKSPLLLLEESLASFEGLIEGKTPENLIRLAQSPAFQMAAEKNPSAFFAKILESLERLESVNPKHLKKLLQTPGFQEIRAQKPSLFALKTFEILRRLDPQRRSKNAFMWASLQSKAQGASTPLSKNFLSLDASNRTGEKLKDLLGRPDIAAAIMEDPEVGAVEIERCVARMPDPAECVVSGSVAYFSKAFTGSGHDALIVFREGAWRLFSGCRVGETLKDYTDSFLASDKNGRLPVLGAALNQIKAGLSGSFNASANSELEALIQLVKENDEGIRKMEEKFKRIGQELDESRDLGWMF